MTTTPNERLARYVFGGLRLIDLWEESLLEGLMTLNGIERVTAGVSTGERHIVFLSPQSDRFTFEAETVITLNGQEVAFSAPAQHGKGPAYTLILNRKHEPLKS